MAKAIMKVIMKLVTSVVNIILLPINSLISSLFPDFSNAITEFNFFVNNFVGSTLGYFSNLIPPFARSIISLWLIFLISYYTISWSYALIIKIYNVIQKIKFW